MKITQLRAFLAVYDTGNVSVASGILGVGQSGTSSALARLRISLNDELFVKTAQGMKPTARAHAIEGTIRRMVEAADLIVAPMETFDPATCNDEFRIVAGDILEGTVLIELVNAFAVSAPSARLASRSLGEHELEEALATGQIDACLGSFETLGPNVRQTSVADFTFACFCNPAHALAGKTISVEQFSNARFAIMDAESNLTNVVEDWFRRFDASRNIAVKAAHFHCLPRLILETDLIAIIPTDPNRNWLFQGVAAQIFLPFELPKKTLNVYWHTIFHRQPRNVWFRRLIAEGLRNQTRMLRDHRRAISE